MDNIKTGQLIRSLRTACGMTQLQLAERLHISDKTVSKWERGLGCPEVSLLPAIADVFGINMESLLAGEMDINDTVGGNMKNLRFFVCPACGNLITATSDAGITCCGKKLAATEPMKAENDEKLSVEIIENDYFISSEHEMTKSHHITFVALLTGDAIMVRKLYPEWNLQTRIPRFGRGKLVWYCTEHGLFYQLVM